MAGLDERADGRKERSDSIGARFGVLHVVDPAFLQTPLYSSLDLLTSGFFTYVFVGHF